MKYIEEIINFIQKHIGNDLNKISDSNYDRYIKQHSFINTFLKDLQNEDFLKNSLSTYSNYSKEEIQNLEDKLIQNLSPVEEKVAKIHFEWLSKNWKKATAIAAILLSCIYFTPYFYKSSNNNFQKFSINQEIIKPGSNRATLRIVGGEIIELNSDKQGIKLGEQLLYNDGSRVIESTKKEKQQTFILTTPKGGQYEVILSDNSKVWLNAESRLEYPMKFNAANRDVILHGEAYFEITKQTNRPFTITTSKEKIKVFGTSFNVNSYSDETNSKVTLTEGKISVQPINNPLDTLILYPNEQAIIQGSIIKKVNVNAEDYAIWRMGEFMFHNESLEVVMKILARWYNFSYEIDESLKNIKFWGSINKYDDFNNVLEIIKTTNNKININIEGRKINLIKKQ